MYDEGASKRAQRRWSLLCILCGEPHEFGQSDIEPDNVHEVPTMKTSAELRQARLRFFLALVKAMLVRTHHTLRAGETGRTRLIALMVATRATRLGAAGPDPRYDRLKGFLQHLHLRPNVKRTK